MSHKCVVRQAGRQSAVLAAGAMLVLAAASVFAANNVRGPAGPAPAAAVPATNPNIKLVPEIVVDGNSVTIGGAPVALGSTATLTSPTCRFTGQFTLKNVGGDTPAGGFDANTWLEVPGASSGKMSSMGYGIPQLNTGATYNVPFSFDANPGIYEFRLSIDQYNKLKQLKPHPFQALVKINCGTTVSRNVPAPTSTMTPPGAGPAPAPAPNAPASGGFGAKRQGVIGAPAASPTTSGNTPPAANNTKRPSKGEMMAAARKLIRPRPIGSKMQNPRLKASPVLATLQAQKTGAESDRTAWMAKAPVPQGNIKAQGNAPSPGTMNTQSEAGPASATDKMMTKSSLPNDLIACQTNSTPYIARVNGIPADKGVTFTPDSNHNTYTIRGCKFGNARGAIRLLGSFAKGPFSMSVTAWDDGHIVATLDPRITGELDHDNVTLEVTPTGQTPIKSTGHHFYAARETVFVKTLPAGVASLFVDTTQKIDYTKQNYFPGSTIESDRMTTFPFVELAIPDTVGKGTDYFNFSGRLKPGFTTDSMAWSSVDFDASACSTKSQPSVTPSWDGDNIKVDYFGGICLVEDAFKPSFSIAAYGLSVWLSGPRGVDPWK